MQDQSAMNSNMSASAQDYDDLERYPIADSGDLAAWRNPEALH